jgi:cytochrome c-type biogenesis protein CcmH
MRSAIATRLLLAVVATLFAFVFLSPEVKYVSGETFAAEKPTNAEVSQSLTCQCGCGLTVANCNMPTCGFSVPMRAEIDSMIGRGMSRAKILAFYRGKYGEKVLSAPTTEGFNILAWTMPFIALFVGGGLIVMVFGRWRAAPPLIPASPGPGGTPVPFDPELKRRLERELEERK